MEGVSEGGRRVEVRVEVVRVRVGEGVCEGGRRVRLRVGGE